MPRARAVSFTKPEREFLLAGLGPGGWNTALFKHGEKLAASVIEKLELSEFAAKKPSHDLTVNAAINAFRGVLRDRLIVPPYSAVGVLAAMKRRIVALGLTEETCAQVARAAAEQWRGPIRAESLVRQADALLAGVQYEGKRTPTPLSSGPLELSEEDI